MMSHHHHDISDKIWEQLTPHLPDREGTWSDKARDIRQFINAVFWTLCTRAPWQMMWVWLSFHPKETVQSSGITMLPYINYGICLRTLF